MKDIEVADFAFLRNGKTIKPLEESEVGLMAPIADEKSESSHALLLLHGFTSTPAVFRQMIAPLRDKGYALHCPVLPGHASSVMDFATVSSSQWLDCVEQHFLDLSARYTKVSVMGLSLGGLLAYHLALKHSFAHLYLLAPSFALPYPVGLALPAVRCLDFVGVKSFKALGGSLKLEEFAELTYNKIPLKAIIAIFNLIKQTRAAKLNCPVDVFVGQYDRVVSNAASRRFLEGQARFHELTNSSHVLPLDGDIEAMLSHVGGA